MKRSTHRRIGLALSLFGSLTACSRQPAATTTAAEHPATSASAETNPTAAPVAVPIPAAPPTASGPRAEIHGDHFNFVAALAAPTAIPGDGMLTVDVHGDTGYHVNNLYPVSLELAATNATAPAQLRRADVAELSQQVASFHVPVHVTGGAAAVHGTMRFAVCSDENCVPQQQAFAVALP